MAYEWNTEDAKVNVSVRGQCVAVSESDVFIPTVTRLAREAGLGSVAVFVGGEQITQRSAPATIGEADGAIEIRAYNKAG